MKGATAQELAKAVHDHAVKQVRRRGGTMFGFVTDHAGTVPPTVTVTLRGSSVPVPFVRYNDQFNPASYATFPEVIIQATGDGDLVVIGALA